MVPASRPGIRVHHKFRAAAAQRRAVETYAGRLAPAATCVPRTTQLEMTTGSRFVSVGSVLTYRSMSASGRVALAVRVREHAHARNRKRVRQENVMNAAFVKPAVVFVTT